MLLARKINTRRIKLESSDKMISRAAKLHVGFTTRPSAYTTAARPFLRSNRFPVTNFCSVRFRTTYTPYAEDLLDLPEEQEIIVAAPHRLKLGQFAIDGSYHEENFSIKPSSSSLYEIAEGGYMEIDSEMVKKFFPEGLAGETADEFALSRKEAWMVRESSKLLCRIIDDFQPVKGKPDSPNSDNINSVESRISIPGLTDRNELHGSSHSLKYYGHELIEKKFVNSRSNSGEDVNLKVTSGIESFADKTLNAIKAHIPRHSVEKPKSGVPDKIMLTGTRGSGKSITLNQMVLHARQSDWLVMFIPDGWSHVQNGPYVDPALGYHLPPPDSDVPVTDTNSRPVFDNTFLSAQALRGFWRANKDKLAKLPISKRECLDKYQPLRAVFAEEWNRAKSVPGRENCAFIERRAIVQGGDLVFDEDEKDVDIISDFEEGFIPETLSDLIKFGVAFRDVAGSVFMDIVSELKDVTDYPILIAVDQYNCWDSSVATAFEYENEAIYGSDLCVTRALSLLTKFKAESIQQSLANGLFVCATSFRHTEGKKVDYETCAKSLPLVLKNPNYSQIEFLSAVSYYAGSRIYSPEWDLNEILSYRMNTASNPRLARVECVPFFFPKSVQKTSEKVNFINGTIDGVSYMGGDEMDGKYELEDPEEEEMKAMQASFAAKKAVKKTELTRAGRLRAKAQK
jgi:hypothetical protein